jgi:hypothetical protein
VIDSHTLTAAKPGQPPSADELAFRAQLQGVFAEMTDLLVAKRRSYGANNLTRFGGFGIVVRASDKIERLATMYRTNVTSNADGDTMTDAWRDLMGYAVLALLHEQEGSAHE